MMMIRRIALAVCPAVACVTLEGVCSAQENASRMEQVIQSYVSSQQFMGSVLMARGETILLDKDSGYDSNSAIILRRASGNSPSATQWILSTPPRGPVNADYVDMSGPFSAGALYSTTEDLLRWEQGLFGGKVLSLASLQKMTTPFQHDYACGLGVRTVKGRKLIEHGGGIEGFNTQLSYYPDDKLTVVVLGNLNGSAPREIATEMAALALGGSGPGERGL
jgi:hypothetical protein